MKRWKIVLISVISALALIISGGLCIFHFFIVPRYVDPFLKTAAEMLESEDVQREISALAHEFSDKGLLDEELMKQYLELYSEAAKQDKGQQTTDLEDEQIEDNGSGPRYSYGKKKSSEPLIKTDDKANDSTASKISDKEKSLYQRIMANVSPEDLSRGYELASKFDLEKVRSLIHNREALKEYMRSTLTDEEYSEVVAFYIKYSYLLTDE